MPCHSRFKRILVTGGAGFIGSAFIRYALKETTGIQKVLNLDALTYAANLHSVEEICQDPRYQFIQGNILDRTLVKQLIALYDVDAIVHFAAESHVDRSIEDPTSFYRTNVEGTLSLLEAVRQKPSVWFHHISTDEVYGSIKEGLFSETSPYKPNSPYSASKAASDHFVRAYAHTYGLKTSISHCSNNFGPFQSKEKFIPKMIEGCIKKEPLPIYGEGENIRDWLFVEDHVAAIWLILQTSSPSSVYNIGGSHEMRNIDLVKHIIDLYTACTGEDPSFYYNLIQFVPDRLGHDFRYAIDSSLIKKELGWKPHYLFNDALKKTLLWSLAYAEIAI